MPAILKVARTFLLICALFSPVFAQGREMPQAVEAAGVSGLLAFASEEGLTRLARSSAKTDFAPLANQFEAQSNIAFCGPTTAAIVLNAMRWPGSGMPRDRSRLHPEDSRSVSAGVDLSVARHTQESVVARGHKTRAQVFGEPSIINGKVLRDSGYQLRQLDELLRVHDLTTRLVIADDQQGDDEIRQDLVANLQHAGDFVIINYGRVSVGQTGGGHISPLGAYDAETDSVLLMDVNASSYGWVWMPVSTLIKGMRTFDTVENRGYVLVSPR